MRVIMKLAVSMVFLSSLNLYAQVQTPVIEKDLNIGQMARTLENFGMNYFSFWEGPSLEDGMIGKNELSRPLDTGLSLFNLVSITYKLTDRYNLDIQNRIELIHTQENEWRFQGIRAGI